MRHADFFTLIFIASIGTLAAFFVCQSIMGDPDEASVSFKALSDVVSSNLAAPDPEVFNSSAINPTVEVYLGGCEDVNQNGILDEVELEACATVDEDEEEEGEGENNEGGEQESEGE